MLPPWGAMPLLFFTPAQQRCETCSIVLVMCWLIEPGKVSRSSLPATVGPLPP